MRERSNSRADGDAQLDTMQRPDLSRSADSFMEGSSRPLQRQTGRHIAHRSGLLQEE